MKARTKLFFVAALGLWALCGSVWAVEGSGPIAHWKFDEGEGSIAYDSAGDNDGTIYGAVWTTGQIDGALSFDGDRDYVMVGDQNSLEPQEFTLSFWAKLNNPSASLQGGIAKGYVFGSGTEYSYQFKFHNGQAYAAVTNTSNIGFNSVTPIGDSDWHMWSMTVGNNNISIYKDGVLNNSIEYTGTIDYIKSHNNFVIGARDDGSFAFNGVIDDVSIYDRVLSADQIQQLYLSGLSSYERAVINIEDAIAEKEEALERIDAALEKEWSAYDTLKELLKSGDYGDLSRRDIFKARRKIRFAIRLEKWSKKVLEKSIEQLEDSLWFLGWEPEPEPNLVAHWKFDEGEGNTATDSAGNNDGTIQGAIWTTGQADGALSFDGVDDYVEVSDNPSLEPQNITVAAWVYRDSTSTRDTILQKGSTSYLDGRNGYLFRILGSSDQEANRAMFYIVVGNNNKVSPVSATPIEAHNWYHITATYDGSNIRIYVNGVEEGTATSETGQVDYTGGQQEFKMGVAELGSGTFQNYFDGTIDDVRFYDLALSADQIQQLYQDGLGGHGKGKK